MSHTKYDINCSVINWNGHSLPDWLFYIPKAKDTFISPAAQFKPVAALNGSPWQTTTTPKQQERAKTLILDTHFYINGLQEHDLIAQIEWFKLQEITVYLCIERDGLKSLVSCNEPNQNFEAYIEFLGQFDETTDYEQLTASNNLVRDTTAVLNVERSQQMFACMNQQKRHIVSNHRGSDDGSATSTPEYRFYDESAYAIHIPYAILAQNKAMKAADYPICLNPPADCADGNDLIHLITQYPYLTHKLLEQNKDLITHELVSAFYHKLPELRAVIIPYCYDLIGQSPIIDIDYYILLKDKLDLHQIPLEHFKLNYSLFKWACPNLEERFDALLHTGFNAKSLLKVFPHRAHEIFSHFPPKDLYDLKDYITAVPEDADSIIQSHQSLLVNATNSKFFLIQIRYFWTVFKNAKTTKALLNDLIQPHLDSMSIIVDYLASEPPEVEAFLKKNNRFTGLSKHFIISLANKNPQMAAYLFKYLSTPLTFIDLECVTNKDLKLSLYERDQPQVRSIKDLIILLSLYPEQFDRLIDEYQFLLENSGSFRVDHLPPKLALTLIQLFPDKAQINEVNTPSINPLWQKPPFINHILNQISRKNIDINSLISYYDQLAFLGRDLAEQIIAEQIPISTEKFSLPALDSRKTKGNITLFETSPIIEIMAQVTYSGMQMLVYTPSFSHPEHPPQYNECTALTIGMLEDALEVDLRKFPNLISLKINLCTASPFKIQQFFDELNQYCPKLSHLNVPESLAPKSCHLPYKINYQKEKKLKESITSSINMVNTIMREIKAYSLQDGASSSHDLPPVDKQAINLFQRTDNSTAKSSSSIFVANNTLSHSTLSPNTSHSFIMVKTGELLNGQGKEPHRLRTGIIELNDDLSRQHTQIPEFILRPLPQKLTPELINVCRLGDDGFYYLLTLKTSANQTVRLLSADAQEELIALDSQGVETKLMRGSDDFYYVLLDKECTLSYVIKAPEPQKSLRSYRHLKADDPIKEILDRYLNLPNYTPESTRFESKRVCETFPEWFERLYTIGQGSCQERCCAVWFQIAKNPIIKDRARLVNIENNHVRLEIKDLEGQWIQVDLGGIRANHCYDNRHSYKAHTLSSAQDIQNRHALNKNHIPNVQASSSSSTSCAPSQSHFYEQKEKWNCTETFVQLETLISNHQIPKIVSHLDQVFDYEQFPVLLIHQNREVCAQQFLHQAKLHNRPVFFLHDPNQVKVGKEQIHLESDSPTISTEDALDLFNKRNRGNPDAMILIDWAAFSPQQRVALNSIIDKKHSLYNKKLKFKIYSLCPELPKDSSFVSRHPHLIKPILPIPAVHTLQAARECTIDLKGLGDWQETLFGPIVLNNNQLEWQRSEFVLALEENDLQPLFMILSNIPTHARKQLNTLLQRAKAQGYLEYHHAQIPLTEQVQFKLDCTEFNITKFQPVHLIKNIESSQLPPDYQVINTELFDFLLTNKKVDQGQYQIMPGWLEQAKDNRLTLFITSELSDHQWYCLLEHAQLYRVELTLLCAKGVSIPHKINVNQGAEPEVNRAISFDEPLIYLSNQPKKCVTKEEQALCFAIEDYNYQDLITWVNYLYQNNQFTDFNEQTSDVFSALKQGRTVVLYGEFSSSLLYALQPLILSQTSQNDKPWLGRLILSIDKKCHPDLRFLPQQCVQSIEFIASNEIKPKIIYKELADDSTDLSDSEQKAERYLVDRLIVLTDAISNYPICTMIGKTGVGKTFLIREIKKRYPEQYQVYHELEHFEDFALDGSDKVKVLFLDEVNIANKHLTMFEPLKEGGNARILYQGRIYELTEKHRIVCAANPLHYGGGRVKQKLFTGQDVPELHLAEMPTYSIYEYLLKPIYHTVAPYMNEQDFKTKCLHFLAQYKQSQLNKENKLCIRNLQEWVISFAMELLKHQPETFLKKRKIHIDAHVTDIIITDSMNSLHKILRRSIEIRKQRYLERRGSIWGLNGCLIEGRPGMGKSELIRFRLAKSGYIQTKPGEDAPENTLTYIKIDASLSDESKKDFIRKAFNQGQIVWLDEVNSILDEGFEHWMNAFLSGFDPDTHLKAQVPGFMLLVTANSIGMEGRSLIGPAFRGRLTQLTMPEPTVKDFEMIIENKLPCQLEEKQRHTMASELVVLMEKNKNLTLREITPKLELISRIYRDSPEVDNALSI